MRQLKITNKITSRDSDSIKSYLSEINKIPLLTDEEELELAIKSQQGDRRAREKLVISNLKFVISVAKQYQNFGILFEDLINEGNIGLIKASERFDPSRGFKFISYAVWWIRQTILESIANNGKSIRIPGNQISFIQKINKCSKEFEQYNDREPTEEELAEIMDEDVYKISMLLRNNNKIASLDAPIGEDSEDTFSLYDLISINDENNIDYEMDKNSLATDIENVMSTINPRQKEIIGMYFGIMGYPKMTLEEIGEYFSLTRERVRQVKDTGIKILRHRSRSKILKQHLK
jgi:RNA polymerase primary sigma factor